MWNENQRRFHLQPRGSPLPGLCPGLTPTDRPSGGRSWMVRGTVGGRGMGCDAPACAGWGPWEQSLPRTCPRSACPSGPHVHTGGPAHGMKQHHGGPEIPAGLVGGEMRPQTPVLKSSPRSLEWPRSETGSVQLELAKMRSSLRWAGPMSPLSL